MMVSFLRGKLKGELLEKQLCAIMHGVFGTDKREEKNWQRKLWGLWRPADLRLNIMEQININNNIT